MTRALASRPGGMPLLRPNAAEPLASGLIGALSALAALALLLDAWTAHQSTAHRPEGSGAPVAAIPAAPAPAAAPVWTVAIPAPAGASPGAEALARRLAAIPGIAAAMPVDPHSVAALTAGILGEPGVEPGAAPLLVDLTLAPGAEEDADGLETRLRTALPTALIARPPTVALPAEAETAGVPLRPQPPEAPQAPVPAARTQNTGGYAGLAVAVAALLLAGGAITVVTRLSISDNRSDIALLRQLGAEEAMIAAQYRRAAARTGWRVGLAGTILGLGLTAAGLATLGPPGLGTGEMLLRLVEGLPSATWTLAAIPALPAAMALWCRAAAGRTCLRALSDHDRRAEP